MYPLILDGAALGGCSRSSGSPRIDCREGLACRSSGVFRGTCIYDNGMIPELDKCVEGNCIKSCPWIRRERLNNILHIEINRPFIITDLLNTTKWLY